MKPVIALLAALMLVAGLFPSPVTAAGFQFDAKGGEPFYQSELPLAVYQYTQRDDLQDITITNAAGEQVPYALLAYDQQYPQKAPSKTYQSLAIFPIQESRLESPDNLRLELQKSADKTTLNVVSDTADTRDRKVILVDAGINHAPLQFLSTDWTGRENQLLNLQILSSDDLKAWSAMGNATLLKTAQNGQTLTQNSISLDAPTTAHYLQIRLASPEDHETLELTRVTAEYRSMQTTALPLLWQNIPFVKRDEKTSPGLVNLDFEAMGHYPASRIRISLPQENTVASVTVLVRNKTDASWKPLTSAMVFRLRQHGKPDTNSDITITPTAARYWRLQFSPSGGGIGVQNPGLSLGWLAPVLVWNARGPAPYTLHVGEASQVTNHIDISSLIPDFKPEQVQQLPKAVLLPPTGNTAGQQPPPNTWNRPVDYKRWLLWGGLFLGVLLLVGMAYSLLKSQSRK